MPINTVEFGGALPIDAYGPGYFRVAGAVHRGPLLIRSEGIVAWQGLSDLPPLAELAGLVDILFLGMGADIAPVPKALRAALDPFGVMCEPMATPAAARTYNVLLSEGRRVAAALMPMPAP